MAFARRYPRSLIHADHCGRAALDTSWTSLREERRARIRAVAMDMREPYIPLAREHLPRAKIVFDKLLAAGTILRRDELGSPPRLSGCTRKPIRSRGYGQTRGPPA
jgi:hypothetical protein